MNAFSIAMSILTDDNIIWRQSATKDDKRLVTHFLEHFGRPLLSTIYATPSTQLDCRNIFAATLV